MNAIWTRHARGTRTEHWTGFDGTTDLTRAQALLDEGRRRRQESSERCADVRQENTTLACLATLSRYMSPAEAAQLTFGTSRRADR